MAGLKPNPSKTFHFSNFPRAIDIIISVERALNAILIVHNLFWANNIIKYRQTRIIPNLEFMSSKCPLAMLGLWEFGNKGSFL